MITSRTNPIITEFAKLKDKKYREKSGLFSFEGRKLFEEAVSRNVTLKKVFYTEKSTFVIEKAMTGNSFEAIAVSDPVYEKLTSDQSPDGIFCVAEHLNDIHKTAETVSKGYIVPKTSIILCDIQDAGNLGTCLRSALAFGIDTVILAGECADVYNGKCVRSSMGAVFSQKTIRVPYPLDAISLCGKSGRKVIAAALSDDSVTLDRLAFDSDTVFAVGNEGHGLSREFVSACDGRVLIPMKGDIESLNAAVASSVLMWEMQKRS